MPRVSYWFHRRCTVLQASCYSIISISIDRHCKYSIVSISIVGYHEWLAAITVLWTISIVRYYNSIVYYYVIALQVQKLRRRDTTKARNGGNNNNNNDALITISPANARTTERNAHAWLRCKSYCIVSNAVVRYYKLATTTQEQQQASSFIRVLQV